MHRSPYAQSAGPLLAMCLASLVIQSCSPGMTAEEKSSWEAVKFLGSTLGPRPFSGPVTFLTSPLEGGQAVVFYPDSGTSRRDPDKYYAFWIHEKTVYAVNYEAASAYPQLAKSPPEVNMGAVILAIADENGVTLKPETGPVGK